MIKPKTILIVEDSEKQLKALENMDLWKYGLTAYNQFNTDKNPNSAYTCLDNIGNNQYNSINPDARKEIRENINRKHQDLIEESNAKLITLARTYSEFECEYNLGVNGVILDLHFPLSYDKSFNTVQPIGIRAALKLEEAGIPFVINAAWNHHGPESQWIYEMITEKKWPIIETHKEGTKNWKKSLDTILNAVNNNVKSIDKYSLEDMDEFDS